MVDCTIITNLECVLEHNNLLTYKLIVLGLLFIYSFMVLRKYENDNFLKLKNEKSNYDYFKDFCAYYGAKIFIYSSPITLVVLRPEITFEMFLKYVAVGYTLFLIVFIGLAILFLEKMSFKILFSKDKVDSVRQRMKYGKTSN